MQTICYWTKRPELSQKAESFAKEQVNHDTQIYRRNKIFTIAGVALPVYKRRVHCRLPSANACPHHSGCTR